MQTVKYLVVLEFGEIRLGLRELEEYYYLDMIVNHKGKYIAINKYKQLKIDYEHLFEHKKINNITDNVIYNTVISNIIHEFLKNVK